MGSMKLTTFDELLDRHIGQIGTTDRDEFDRQVKEAVQAYEIGEAIKKARLSQNLTQEELGARIGVKKSQISRLERGHSITIPTMCRVFQALGIASAALDLGTAGRVSLW